MKHLFLLAAFITSLAASAQVSDTADYWSFEPQKIDALRLSISSDYFQFANYQAPSLFVEVSYGPMLSAQYYALYDVGNVQGPKAAYNALPIFAYTRGGWNYAEAGAFARLYPLEQPNRWDKPSSGFYFQFGFFQYRQRQNLDAVYNYVDSTRFIYEWYETYKVQAKSSIGVAFGGGVKTFHTKFMYTDVGFVTQRTNPDKFYVTVTRLSTRGYPDAQVEEAVAYDMNLLQTMVPHFLRNGQLRIEGRIGINLDFR